MRLFRTIREEPSMKAKLLHEAGSIEDGATVEVSTKVGHNEQRDPEDVGGASTTPAPVYSVTDKDGNTEEVDTRDLKIIP
jgi:hypothetical protein